MKTIYLIRHCQATGQDADAPLTPVGQKQAIVLAAHLAKKSIDRIVASPSLRAIQSIQPFADTCGLAVETDQRLTERILSGQPRADWLMRLEESFVDLDIALDGGESSHAAMKRAAAAVQDILKAEYHQIAIVTHGNLMALLLRHFGREFGFEEWRSLSNPDVYEVKILANSSDVRRSWMKS